MKAITNTGATNQALNTKSKSSLKLRIVNFIFFIIITCGQGISSPLAPSEAPPAPTNIYWIGGTGDWNDINHWAKSSGSTNLAGTIPTANSIAVIDANSGLTSTSTISIPPGDYDVHTLNITNTTGFTLLMNGTSSANNVIMSVYGDITFPANFNMAYGNASIFSNQWKFVGTNTHVINSGAHDLLHVDFFTGGGTYNQASELFASLRIRMHGGTWNSNNHNITTVYLLFQDTNGSSNPIPKLFNAGTSNIYCDEWFSQFTYQSLEVTGYHVIHTKVFSGSPGTSINNFSYHEIHLLEYQDNPTGGSPIEHNNFECTYCEVENLIIEDTGDTRLANKFTVNGILEVVNQGSTIKFNGGNNRLDEVVLNGTVVTPAAGTCQERTIFTNDFNDFTTIIRNSGTLTISNAIIEDISTSGGATFEASNGLLLGASTGWNQINPPVATNFTWGNDTTIIKSWNDAANWLVSGTSNGCIPTIFDDVTVDNSSNGGILIPSGVTAECRNFEWTKTSPDSLTLNGITNSSSKLLITGNIQLHGSAKIKATGEYDVILFNTFGIKTINTGAVKLPRVSFTSQAGEWHLLNKFEPSELLFQAGTLDTKGKQITTNVWTSIGDEPKNYILNSSKIGINGEFKVSDLFNYGSVTLNAGTSSISCQKLTSTITDFYNVTFNNTVPRTLDNYTYNFNKIILNSAHQVTAVNTLTVNDLVFTKDGSSLAIDNVDGLVISGGIQSTASASNPGILKSDLAGTRAEVSNAVGNICVVGRVGFQDIEADMLGVFHAPAGYDNGNNAGINFDNGINSTELYWRGGSGDWHVLSNWSTVSGGCPSSKSPALAARCVFDPYSFSTNNEIVNIPNTSSTNSIHFRNSNYFARLNIADTLIVDTIYMDDGFVEFLGNELYVEEFYSLKNTSFTEFDTNRAFLPIIKNEDTSIVLIRNGTVVNIIE